MNHKIIILGSITVVLVSLSMYFTQPKTSNAIASFPITNYVVCMIDTNNDGKINLRDNKEFIIASISNCRARRGAPGYTVAPVKSKTPFGSVLLRLNVLKSNLLAAVSYSSPSPTPLPSLSPRPSPSLTPTPSVSPSPSPRPSVTPSTRPSPSLTPKPTPTPIPTPTVGTFIDSPLSPPMLSKLNDLRKKAGLDKKIYEPGTYVCKDYARDMEKTDPQDLTFTTIACNITSSKNGSLATTYFSHAINDVHDKGKTSYYDPQTGKEVTFPSNTTQQTVPGVGTIADQRGDFSGTMTDIDGNFMSGVLYPDEMKAAVSYECHTFSYEDAAHSPVTF